VDRSLIEPGTGIRAPHEKSPQNESCGLGVWKAVA
jgi:hypothetical protein